MSIGSENIRTSCTAVGSLVERTRSIVRGQMRTPRAPANQNRMLNADLSGQIGVTGQNLAGQGALVFEGELLRIN